MSMDMFDNIIGNIDEDYPFSLSPKIILTLLVVMGICVTALGMILLWYKRKATLSSSTVWNLVKLVPSLAGNTPSLDSLLPMLSELASSSTNLQTTPTTSHQAAADKLTLLTPSMFIPRLHTTPHHHLHPLHSHLLNFLKDHPTRLTDQNTLLWGIQLNLSLLRCSTMLPLI